MSFSIVRDNPGSGVMVFKETTLLPADTTPTYGSSIKFALPDYSQAARKIAIGISIDTVTGADVDFALMGVIEGVETLLLDAFIADYTNGSGLVTGVVDLNAYPAQEYKIRFITAGNESANTLTMYVTVVNPRLDLL
jgi:hypothetical protein